DYGLISGSKLDFLIGYNFNYNSNGDSVNSSILVGMRKGEYNDGFTAAWDTRRELSDKAFMENSIGLVVWNNDNNSGNSAVTNWRLTLGYDLFENTAIKGGISSYSNSYDTDYGLTFGMQTKY
ncbi:MAG: hypothetical protein AWU54_1791, partial [Candidatus Frackibacter sp. T328-2]